MRQYFVSCMVDELKAKDQVQLTLPRPEEKTCAWGLKWGNKTRDGDEHKDSKNALGG